MTWKCKHCNNIFDFERTTEKANHTRWCNSNPKSKQFRIETSKLSKVIATNNIDKKYGKKKEYEVTCNHCSKLFKIVEREKRFPTKERYYCSKTCASSHSLSCFWEPIKTGKKILDENFGFKNKNNWMKSYIAKQQNEYNVKPLYITICKNCNNTFQSKQQRIFCSVKCTHEYRRKDMEPLKAYRKDAAFDFNLKDYPERFDFNLIEQYGWYKAANHGNNLNGVSRDHMVSVKYGFDNNIDPKIIGHPANCKLIRHSENSSKHSGCSITIEDLLERIEKW